MYAMNIILKNSKNSNKTIYEFSSKNSLNYSHDSTLNIFQRTANLI